MALTLTDPWRAMPRGTPEQAIEVFTRWGSFPIGDVADASREVYRLCHKVRLDASLLVSHMAVETGDENEGKAFLDENWATVNVYRAAVNRYNIAGIGVTDGADLGYGFPDGTTAARAFVVHHAVYEIPADDPAWEHLAPYIHLDPRYGAVPKANRGTVKTVNQMNGKWWTNPKGALALRDRGNSIFSDLSPYEPKDEPDMPEPKAQRYVLSAGHRNLDRGGAKNEINWTYPSVVALAEAIRARSGSVVIVQEQDGDYDPTFYRNGGLQAAARTCVGLASKYGPFTAYISSHYNGSPAGFHAIFPDGSGDSKAINTLDLKLCRTMAKHIKGTGTVKLLTWPEDSDGVMSEKETGVGSQGYRLGEFVGTLGFRETTARVVIEASGILSEDAKYINDPKWVRNVYAEAICDALEEVFGPMAKDPDMEAPELPEEQPGWPYPAPVPIKALVDYDLVTKGDTLPAVTTDEGTRFTFVHDVFEVINPNGTRRLRYAHASSESVGPNLEYGKQFIGAWVFTAGDGRDYILTGSWTRVLLEDCVRISDAPHLNEV